MIYNNKTNYKKLKRNKNISMSRYSRHKGLNVIEGKGPLIPEYLDRIIQTFDKSLSEYPETVLMRFDLRYPYWFNQQDVKALGSTVISRFFASLKAQLEAYVKRMRLVGYKVDWSGLRYIWCKEQPNNNDKPHYHVAIFLSHNLFEFLTDERFEEITLDSMVGEAWARMLGFSSYEVSGAVWFPDNCVYHLSVNDKACYASAFYRVSYFAKTSTKLYGDGSQWFGSSRT